MAKLDSTSLRLRKPLLTELDELRPKPLGSRDAFIERLIREVIDQIKADEAPGTLPVVQFLRELQHKKTAADTNETLLERLTALEKQMIQMAALAHDVGNLAQHPEDPARKVMVKPDVVGHGPAPCPPPEIPAKYTRAPQSAVIAGKGGSTPSLNERPTNEKKPIGSTRKKLREMVDREAEEKSSEQRGS